MINNEIKRTCSLLPFSRFLEDLDKSAVTGWRWRQAGVVATVNIAGKVYITEDEIRRFEARAAAGEFSRENNAPIKRKSEDQ